MNGVIRTLSFLFTYIDDDKCHQIKCSLGYCDLSVSEMYETCKINTKTSKGFKIFLDINFDLYLSCSVCENSAPFLYYISELITIIFVFLAFFSDFEKNVRKVVPFWLPLMCFNGCGGSVLYQDTVKGLLK